MGSPAGGRHLAAVAFAASSLAAGGNALGIRFSNRELEPLWGGALRFSIASVLMIALMGALRVAVPRGQALRASLLYGAFTFGASYALAYYGFVRVHAGLGQTLFALVPLATLLLATLQRQERMSVRATAGALFALLGVAALSEASLHEPVPRLSLLALVASAFCFAQGAVLVRRFPPVHPVAMNAVAMTVGATMLLGGSVLSGETIELPRRGSTIVAVAYLVLVGSILLFLLYLVVLRHWTASRAAYAFLLTPIITVLLSAWLDDEPLRAGLVVGGLMIVAGVYVGALRNAPVPRVPVD